MTGHSCQYTAQGQYQCSAASHPHVGGRHAGAVVEPFALAQCCAMDHVRPGAQQGCHGYPLSYNFGGKCPSNTGKVGRPGDNTHYYQGCLPCAK